MLPNFLHIGAAKCASTWLWRVYQEHPEIVRDDIAALEDLTGRDLSHWV